MYTDLKTILDDAAKNNYAVIATSAINLETARGILAAATDNNAPIIFLLGQNMMRQHAKAELLVPMIKTMAEMSDVPVAVCLDHGNDPERIMYAFRNGFSSIMYDGSLLEYEKNVKTTKRYTDIFHQFGIGVEGELGHVGLACNGDGQDESIYTSVEEAVDFVSRTNVDCLAIAVGTAHGEYPNGLIPHINFTRIREIKKALNGMPLALHGGSGAGDENIKNAVEAGMNKINVVTDVFNVARNYCAKTLSDNPKENYINLMSGMENAVREYVSHWIGLTNSAGKAKNFRPLNIFDTLIKKRTVGDSE